MLTTNVFNPGLSLQPVTDRVERNSGDCVGTVEVGVTGQLQLKQNLLVKCFIVAVQLGSLGVLRSVSVTELFSFRGIPSVREAPYKDIQEGKALYPEVLRVESTAGLRVLPYSEGEIFLHSVSRRLGRLWAERSQQASRPLLLSLRNVKEAPLGARLGAVLAGELEVNLAWVFLKVMASLAHEPGVSAINMGYYENIQTNLISSPNSIGAPNQSDTLRLVERGGVGGLRQATQSQGSRLGVGLQDLSH